MIWPTNLVNCALFNTLHSQQYSGMGTRGGISRERFFTYAFLGSLCWYFFPGYIFQGPFYLHRWIFLIADVTYISSRLFQLGMLDCTRERGRQSAVWLFQWLGHVAHHVRLVTNCVHWLTTCNPVVGGGKCRSRFCGLFL